MRSPRKIAITLAAIAAVLLVALITLPYLFRDRIAAKLKTEVAGAVNARVDWRGVGLSVLRDFPNVTLSLDHLSIAGVGPFVGDTLASIADARLVLDVGSVIRGDRIVVRKIDLRQPAVHLRVLENGATNWDITRPSKPSADTGRAIGVTLRDFRISDGTITMDDRKSRLAASVTGLDQSLSGDFAKDRFTIQAHTKADSVSVDFAGIPYLHHVGLEVNADVAADLPAKRFTFGKNSVRLNKLVLAFAGSATLGKPDIALDINFSTPSTAFGDILSLVPAIYARDFAQIQTTGTMSAAGRVRGTYGPKAFPALTIAARVDNGTFRYPSLPLPARDIALDLAIDNPGGNVDATVVDLKRFHAAVGGQPIDAKLVMRTPVSDPDVDFALTGRLNLTDLSRTVKIEGVKQLTGQIAADVAMRARLSDVDAGRYDRVAARGTMGVSRLAVQTAAVPRPMAVDTAALQFTPRNAQLTAFAGRIGNSDVRATGSLDNVLGFVLRKQELRGTATVASNHFDLNEWKSNEKTTQVIPVPPHVDFALKATAAEVLYGKILATNVRGGLHVKDQRVTIEALQMDALRGGVVANGYYETVVLDRPSFDVDLALTKVDIPTAFAALTTVQALAPVARWAQGSLSGTVKLKGVLGQDMTPVFTALTGQGGIETERLVMQNAPVLGKLADALSIDAIRNPAIGAFKANFDVADGRLHMKPFTVKMAGMDVNVTGSNGIDQSIKYDLAMALPQSMLGGAAGRAVSNLASQAGKAGFNLAGAGAVQIGAQLTGTVTNPSVRPSFGGVAGSPTDIAKQVATTGVATVKLKADSAATEARRRASVEADRLVKEAEAKAATIREQARALAATTKAQGYAHADSLQARATNPLAKMAAQAATDRLRREADQRADQIVHEADAKADALVAQAKQKAASVAPPKS